MNSKNTKRALVSSALAVLVCIAMLIGTTFAWFTDTASTSVNKIVSGKLDVLLEYAVSWDADGNPTEWKDAKDQSLEFKKAAAGEAVLWEPGCTYELPELRVSNAGNLALKYKVAITGINGSAKLNEVIDWTVDGADIGKEYHLLPGAANEITVSGHMQETAGNEYMNESIDGIGITVYAVQDTVESDSYGKAYDKNADGTPAFDTWLDNVSADAEVKAGQDTVIKDRETDPTVTATVPADSVTADTLTLIKTKGATPASIEVVTGTEAVTADVKIVNQNGEKVAAKAGKFFTLQMQVAKNANVIGFYHNGAALTKVTAAPTANDQYYYDAATGVITFTTDDFSPFTVVISDSDFNGGDGTEANPYLIATGEQALVVKNSKGYFKLVNDIVVPNEIYMGGKTYVWDLNGHSIRLEYADGVKPNNGSVMSIGSKNGKLTINDSSAAQTGAIIGSDKSYANKVTCAIRINYLGNLTINGGHFYGMSEGTSCIYTYGKNATVTINGGVFETASPYNGTYFVLNHEDGKAGSSWNNKTGGSKMIVNGGKFKGYNPGVTVVDPVNSGTGVISLGTGCTTTSEEVDGATWYTVSK